LELTIDWAFCPGSITTPLHDPATAGPALSDAITGGFGSSGSLGVVVVAVGFLVGSAVVRRVVDGLEVAVDLGRVVPGFGAVVADVPGRCDGSTRDAARSDSWNRAAVVVALFSLAITGTAIVTTASAAAISATNHNFLKTVLLGTGERPGVAKCDCCGT
jgi:hypothetical protein